MITEKTVLVAGNRLVCLVAGNPVHTPILMIHGWAHHPYIWQSTIHALSDRYYCVAVGLLGFGASDKPADGDYSVLAHARATLDIADTLGLERFIVFGQSRGGQIALWLAACLAPQRVTQVASISGVVTGHVGWYLRTVFGNGMHFAYHVPLGFRVLRRLWAIPSIGRLLYGPYFFDGRHQPPEVTQQDGAYAFAVGGHRVNWPALQTMCATNLLSVLPQITVPTLVLFGKQDRIVPPTEGLIAARHIPHAELVLLDCCGHYPMIDQPALYLRVIHQFLDQHASS